MHTINLLIKPASSSCNFKCKYCFYEDISENRKQFSYGYMDLETLEIIVKKAILNTSHCCNFAFQGGEPTLVGILFYKKFIEYVKKYNKKNIKVGFSIQTNGYFLDDEFAKFFAENNFLVGLSLDGTKEVNDFNRICKNNFGTYDIILEKINLLKKYNVQFNILTVVTKQVAKNINKIYDFYKKENLIYQQYIPCLNPIGNSTVKEYSLLPDLYGKFLCNLFDLWYKDIMNNKFIYNRYFENILAIMKGYRPESCGMLGFCSIYYLVEADGSVYPCDFYVLDEYKIGNFIYDSFEKIEQNRENINFIKTSLKIEESCKKCKWINLCRGGCKRYRDLNLDGNLTLNYYCLSYKQFFEYSIDRLANLSKMI